MAFSKEFLERTIQVWQPYSKEKLTLNDAEEITRNVANYFNLLIELDKKYYPLYGYDLLV